MTAPATDPTPCAQIVHYNSRNPDSFNFGPPDCCESDAVPGSEYCAIHGGGDDQ